MNAKLEAAIADRDARLAAQEREFAWERAAQARQMDEQRAEMAELRHTQRREIAELKRAVEFLLAHDSAEGRLAVR